MVIEHSFQYRNRYHFNIARIVISRKPITLFFGVKENVCFSRYIISTMMIFFYTLHLVINTQLLFYKNDRNCPSEYGIMIATYKRLARHKVLPR